MSYEGADIRIELSEETVDGGGFQQLQDTLGLSDEAYEDVESNLYALVDEKSEEYGKEFSPDVRDAVANVIASTAAQTYEQLLEEDEERAEAYIDDIL